ncbi:sugar transferase [Sphingomonas sp. SUN019]|uniref:sugar transferase n=1 Tax=Sphingomonas sp. SUN019 TaxID=2937788 RepID=UPI0021641353|nr:sugar transferase [Sphingomonas sp. SUN019]UVO49044.1 sugar transferase [Sphingomonas sp. SUN019]
MMVLVGYLGIALAAEVYNAAVFTNPKLSLKRSVTALSYALVAVVFFTYVAHASEQIARLTFAVGSALALLFLVIGRVIFVKHGLKRMAGSLHNELLIIDGVDAPGLAMTYRINARAMGLSPDLSDPEMLHRIGDQLAVFDRVIVSCDPDRRHAWSTVLRGANIDGELLLHDRSNVDVIGIGHVAGQSTHIVSRGPLSMSSRAVKRGLDLVFTVPAILALSPLLAIVALAIKLDSRGPVFFRQDRVGRRNQLFRIVKFRTMRHEDRDIDGVRSASRDDDRITRVGRLLRRTSLDELPQLFNVLEGDMSLVGPRPHALGSLAGDKLFWEINHEYWIRHALKPGITGLAQIRGYRGATEQREDLELRLAADLEYLDDWSISRDLGILASTAMVLVHRNAF